MTFYENIWTWETTPDLPNWGETLDLNKKIIFTFWLLILFQNLTWRWNVCSNRNLHISCFIGPLREWSWCYKYFLTCLKMKSLDLFKSCNLLLSDYLILSFFFIEIHLPFWSYLCLTSCGNSFYSVCLYPLP